MYNSTLINTNEAAGILNCTPDKVALLIRKGRLKAIRRKNRWMLNPKEVKKHLTTKLRLDFINSLPQPLVAVLLNGSQWEVNDIDVETGLLRIIVSGMLQVMHISEIDSFLDAEGITHSTDSFYEGG